MYAKVKLLGHPVHAMLVGIPVTAYLTTFVCFCAYALGADVVWFRVGMYANVVGVIAAAVAAVPGFIDWSTGIPAGIPAKRTGVIHMLLNVMALVAFTFNAFAQWGHRFDPAPPGASALAFSLIGIALVAAAGFQGWKLVQRHHVGVDLTPEQERFEPRPPHRVERDHTSLGGTRGHPIR